MSDPLKDLEQAVCAQVSNEEADLKTRLAEIVARHQENEDKRDARLDEYRDEEGEVTDYYGYDSTRTENADECEEELPALLTELAELLKAAA
ncbi:hypothetical protein [Streptomyces sp. NPDC004135]